MPGMALPEGYWPAKPPSTNMRPQMEDPFDIGAVIEEILGALE
jgi:hypothetical protein